MRIRPAQPWPDVVLRCGAQESPLDSGSIPIKVAVLYVGEVLLLRYMLDDPEHTNEPGPHQRGGGHQADLNSKTGGIQLWLSRLSFRYNSAIVSSGNCFW